MISKNQLKKLKALANKKQRRLSGQFLVQGEKSVLELLDSNLNVAQLFVTQSFYEQYTAQLQQQEVVVASPEELQKASTFSSNDSAIAIAEIPTARPADFSKLVIALDDINDPGNLGTILRFADWYGIKDVIVSPNTADEFNPKVVNSSMGAFARVNVIRTDLVECLKAAQVPILGAFLEGESVHDKSLPEPAILLMGNESHGISEELAKLVTDKITIPRFGHAESLNVAMATGIILDNIKRVNR